MRGGCFCCCHSSSDSMDVLALTGTKKRRALPNLGIIEIRCCDWCEKHHSTLPMPPLFQAADVLGVGQVPSISPIEALVPRIGLAFSTDRRSWPVNPSREPATNHTRTSAKPSLANHWPHSSFFYSFIITNHWPLSSRNRPRTRIHRRVRDTRGRGEGNTKRVFTYPLNGSRPSASSLCSWGHLLRLVPSYLMDGIFSPLIVLEIHAIHRSGVGFLIQRALRPYRLVRAIPLSGRRAQAKRGWDDTKFQFPFSSCQYVPLGGSDASVAAFGALELKIQVSPNSHCVFLCYE
ncbi:hypothetical protein BDY19DRAFT_721435 [Irpex rosettiformis]|uniref:Uncharacterized protein n=1 Tax=Irpex rosettiformis TaxID=378272 RepID=A0ACB8U8N0_9APHY|nr:hypothetical protein BDY19DRAFT_721435 [Irpex rosettiformis]